MKYKINLLLQKISWEYVVLYSFYGCCFLVAVTAYQVIRTEFRAAEEACQNRNGVLLQEKQGSYVCIKRKSIIQLEPKTS
jgi:hypothetical protein